MGGHVPLSEMLCVSSAPSFGHAADVRLSWRLFYWTTSEEATAMA
jgi:hypothetical protein